MIQRKPFKATNIPSLLEHGKNYYDVSKHHEKIVEKNQNTILTNDPSMTAWGWAVVTFDGKILKTGCIKTETEGKKRRIRKSDETSQRISEINNVLIGLIKEHNVNLILSESPHGSQNASAAVMIGAVAAIIQTISDCFDIAVEFYSEQDSKKCLLGKKSATKQETIDAIAKLYDVKWTGIKYKDEAVADAIAIHYVASKQSTTLKMLKQR
jgi:Holliday junction resolvasome RuvABC endonuclease subunit